MTDRLFPRERRRADSHPAPFERPFAGHLAAFVLLLLTVLSGGCANVRGGWQQQPKTYDPPTKVSVAQLFVPGTLPPAEEIGYLGAVHSNPARLRRAWLQLELGRLQDAVDSTSEVLFAPQEPSPHDESYARYLRAEAYRRMGTGDGGAYDLGRARELAMDPELRKLIGAPLDGGLAGAGNPTGTPWGGLDVQARGSWASLRPNASNLDPMQRPSRVTIHHSAMYFRGTQPRAAAGQIARIQHEHMRGRGYGDIGYHFLIDPSGRIWEGRELRYQGAHAHGSNNIGNIGICLLGNFVRETDGQQPTREQVASMEQLVVQLMRHYRFDGSALFCHSDFRNTQCPGPRMAPIVRQLARALDGRAAVPVAAAAPDDEEEDE